MIPDVPLKKLPNDAQSETEFDNFKLLNVMIYAIRGNNEINNAEIEKKIKFLLTFLKSIVSITL